MPPRIDRFCKHCGSLFYGHKSKRYCSESCRSEAPRPEPYNKGRLGVSKGRAKNGQLKYCLRCGAKFYNSACRSNGKYCSPSCYRLGRWDGTRIETIICSNCDTPFEAIKSTKRVFCSQSCYWQKKKGSDHYRPSLKGLATLSELTARRVASGDFGACSSSLEETVAQHLDDMGVQYQRQVIFRDKKTGQFSAVVDFFFPDLNAVIEVNGTYWHADQRVYSSNSLDNRQTEAVAKYQRKLGYLKEADIQVAEVWELDLKAKKQTAVQKAYDSLLG